MAVVDAIATPADAVTSPVTVTRPDEVLFIPKALFTDPPVTFPITETAPDEVLDTPWLAPAEPPDRLPVIYTDPPAEFVMSGVEPLEPVAVQEPLILRIPVEVLAKARPV